MFDLNSENMNKNTNDFKSSAGLNLTKQNRKSGTRTEFLHIKKINSQFLNTCDCHDYIAKTSEPLRIRRKCF